MCPNCNLRRGHELLDYLCSACYSLLIILPLAEAEFAAGQATMEAYHRRYIVECELGLRTPPTSEGETASAVARNLAPARRIRPQLSTESTDIEDIFEDE